jgi:hypothetical protein
VSSLTAATTLPTTDEEIWRYSRIAELDLDRYAIGRAATTVSGGGDLVSQDPADAHTELFGDDTPDVFADLNRSHMAPVVIRVPAGHVATEPIVVTHRVDASDDGGVPPTRDRCR